MKDGQQIRFNNEGDQTPGMEPSDIVVVLDEKEHNFFARKGKKKHEFRAKTVILLWNIKQLRPPRNKKTT